MEHRTDLEEILLSDLPANERDHVKRVIRDTSVSKFAHLRAVGARDLEREAKMSRVSEASDVEDEDVCEQD